MRVLLDTHVVLWWLSDEPMHPDAIKAIADSANEVWVSAATAWEVETKRAAGKLRFDGDFEQSVNDEHMTKLPITFGHARAAAVLPSHHKDPFDRLLIAQAQTEQLMLVSRDEVFARYGVPLLRA